MDRDELEEELAAVGVTADAEDSDDRLRDALVTALSDEDSPDTKRADFLRDQQKDDDLRGDK